MAEETWTTIALPVLEEVRRGESDDPRVMTAALLGRLNTEAPMRYTFAALLEDGYITGAAAHWPLGRGEPVIVADVLRLTPKGRRAIGEWPSGESGEVLIRALEEATSRLPEGETKKRMSGLLQAAREVGTDILSGVVTNVVKSTMGLP
ncbi:MAG: hypothetical protein ACYCSF_12100 [Acidimicrobiales bacterium]